MNDVELFTPVLSLIEHRAIKALASGNATPDQQGVALKVIHTKFSRANDLLYVPSNNAATAFLNGRAFVGQQILKYINLPLDEESP